MRYCKPKTTKKDSKYTANTIENELGIMKRIKKYIYTTIITTLLAACNQVTNLELPDIISNGMVLQQNSQMVFWGKALPGSYIALKTDWDFSNTATAQPDSTWSITFPTIKADNQKHSITISTADTTILINDILLGEVWLAAGQSNMSMPLEGWDTDTISNSQHAIAEANDNKLRIFKAARHFTWEKEPLATKGSWKHTTPKNARSFSATAYFFAQTLRDSLKVPVGIIDIAVSSTPCEAWICDKQLLEHPDFSHKVANLELQSQEMQRYIQWLCSLPEIKIPRSSDHEGKLASLSVNDEFVTLSSPSCDDWEEIQLPKFWDNDKLGEFDGLVWFVKKVEIPHNWVGKPLTLYLGAIDDCDVTYVNGVRIGEHIHTGEYNIQREYTIKGKVNTSTTLTIAVRVTDTGGEGGFSGCPKGMRIELTPNESINIEGTWKYRPAGEFYNDNLIWFDPIGNTFASRQRPEPFLTHRSPAAIYYGMIYPIANYNIAGIIWSQGEANVRRAKQYQELMPLLISSFKETFNNPKLPFIYAQLAPWHYSDCDNTELAPLREAQRQASHMTDNTYMFSSADLGDNQTLHGPNKKEYGNRYAREALHHVYGFKNVTPSGPTLTDIKSEGQFIILTFENYEGLHVDNSKPIQLEIAGDDLTFFEATTITSGDHISLFSHAVAEPKYVRYLYKNCSEPTIFNGENLPAEAFFYCGDSIQLPKD